MFLFGNDYQFWLIFLSKGCGGKFSGVSVDWCNAPGTYVDENMRFDIFGLLFSFLNLLEPGASVNVPLWPSVIEALKQNPRDENAKVLL